MRIQKKRRQEFKTDYKKRIGLLKSENPRLIFRRTNRYIITQYILSSEAKDKATLGITSKALLKYGWPKEFEGSLKSISAAYLTGYLMGKIILEKKLNTPIVDFGMTRTNHKTKVYGFLKGLVDSGLKIKHDAKTFPEEERITGKKLKKDFSSKFNEIKLKINKQ